MRIISKFKDYYDYLQGIYGIDEKLILDRTEYKSIPYIPSVVLKESIIIGDYLVEGLWYKGNIYYGKEIENLGIAVFNTFFDKQENVYYIKNERFKVSKEPILLKNSPAYELKCPILIKKWNGYDKNPILKEYSLHKVYSAFEIWNMLSEFLGKLNDRHIESIQTDKEKILSHGFDLKSSFRKVK
jgi:hypothetical protein